MELSPEDSLRLNVMIPNVVAIRIDETRMIVYGLSVSGDEISAALHPTGNPERYLKQVRELLSTMILDSPGGYPVYIKRWSRMGHTRNKQLEKLLMIGEMDAVTAVSRSPDLNDTLAERVWWAATNQSNQIEIGCYMLSSECVLDTPTSKVIANYLFEHLPFMTRSRDVINTVNLLLQKDLINEETRQGLWKRGKHKIMFQIGFLERCPEQLPVIPIKPHPLLAQYGDVLGQQANNPIATFLLQLLDTSGQAFVQTCQQHFKRIADDETAYRLFNAIGQYFSVAQQHKDDPTLFSELPEMAAWWTCCRQLANTHENQIIHLINEVGPIGSLIRKKITPVSQPILENLKKMNP
jgi:hypothetical protein